MKQGTKRKPTYKQMALETAVRNPERYIGLLTVLKSFDGEILNDKNLLKIVSYLYLVGEVSSDDIIITNKTKIEDIEEKVIEINSTRRADGGFPMGYQSRFWTYMRTPSELGFIFAQYEKEFKFSDIAKKLKGSILMTGPLLARFGEAFLFQSGGCVIGQRPRDIFLEGFKAFGATVKENKKTCCLTIKKLKGTKFVFPLISVTATETMILTAVLAEGKTLLSNAACEPEIVFLVDFLNKRGAKIKGAGTPFIEINGVKSLSGGQCKILPDRIEAGSFVILGAATNSPIKITGIEPSHLDVLWFLLKKAGVNLKIGKDFVEVKPPFKIKATDLKTHEYPGFPTDLQAPFTVLMTQAEGVSLIHETIFEGRLFYTDALNQMGAKIIMCDPHRVIVQGPSKLYGRRLISPDIRAGIALVIASLIAEGESVIENIYQIDRGYEKIEERLLKIGADIKRKT